MGVVGAAIKGFGKALKVGKRDKVINRTTGKPFPESTQRHMRASSKRHAGMKKAGYKGPKYRPEFKGKGPHELHEVWEYNPYPDMRTPKKSKLKKILTSKKTKAVGKGALVGGAVASGVEYKRRKDRGDYKK